MTTPRRASDPAFIPRRGGRPTPSPGAGVRFVTCTCGAERMAVNGQAGACPGCGEWRDHR